LPNIKLNLPRIPPTKNIFVQLIVVFLLPYSLGATVAPVLISRATDADANARRRDARCALLHSDAAFGRRAPPRHTLMVLWHQERPNAA